MTVMLKGTRHAVDGELSLNPKSLVLRFAGKIDEDMKFAEIAERLREILASGDALLLDMSGVRAMNSVGIRSLGFFIRDVQEQYAVRFSRLSETVVEQASLVPGMLGDPLLPIDQVELPYLCPSCNKRIGQMTSFASLAGKRPLKAPPMKCPSCGTEMEFDAPEDEFLKLFERA